MSWYKIVTTIKENTEKDDILNQHPKTIRFHIKEFKSCFRKPDIGSKNQGGIKNNTRPFFIGMRK